MDNTTVNDLTEILGHLKKIESSDEQASGIVERILLALNDDKTCDYKAAMLALLIYIAIGLLSPDFTNAIVVSRDIVSIPAHFKVMTANNWVLVGLLLYFTKKFPFTEDALRLAASIIDLPVLIKSLEECRRSSDK